MSTVLLNYAQVVALAGIAGSGSPLHSVPTSNGEGGFAFEVAVTLNGDGDLVLADGDFEIDAEGNVFASRFATPSGGDSRYNGPTDTNWRLGIVDVLDTQIVGAATSLQIITGAGNDGPDGFAVGNTNGQPALEVRGYDGLVLVDNTLQVGTGTDPLTLYSDGTDGGWATNVYALGGGSNGLNIYTNDGVINVYNQTNFNAVTDLNGYELLLGSGAIIQDNGDAGINFQGGDAEVSITIEASGNLNLNGNYIDLNDGSGSGGTILNLDGATFYLNSNSTTSAQIVTDNDGGIKFIDQGGNIAGWNQWDQYGFSIAGNLWLAGTYYIYVNGGGVLMDAGPILLDYNGAQLQADGYGNVAAGGNWTYENNVTATHGIITGWPSGFYQNLIHSPYLDGSQYDIGVSTDSRQLQLYSKSPGGDSGIVFQTGSTPTVRGKVQDGGMLTWYENFDLSNNSLLNVNAISGYGSSISANGSGWTFSGDLILETISLLENNGVYGPLVQFTSGLGGFDFFNYRAIYAPDSSTIHWSMGDGGADRLVVDSNSTSLWHYTRSRILIDPAVSATDDGTTALQVNGGASFTETVAINCGSYSDVALAVGVGNDNRVNIYANGVLESYAYYLITGEQVIGDDGSMYPGGSSGNSYFDASGNLNSNDSETFELKQNGNAVMLVGISVAPNGIEFPYGIAVGNGGYVNIQGSGGIQNYTGTTFINSTLYGNPNPLVLGAGSTDLTGPAIDMALPTTFRDDVDFNNKSLLNVNAIGGYGDTSIDISSALEEYDGNWNIQTNGAATFANLSVGYEVSVGNQGGIYASGNTTNLVSGPGSGDPLNVNSNGNLTLRSSYGQVIIQSEDGPVTCDNRLLVNSPMDDGTSALLVNGGASFTDNLAGPGWSISANGSGSMADDAMYWDEYGNLVCNNLTVNETLTPSGGILMDGGPIYLGGYAYLQSDDSGNVAVERDWMFGGKLNVGGNTTSTAPLNIKNIPTSAAGLSSGDIWSNLGILTIVP